MMTAVTRRAAGTAASFTFIAVPAARRNPHRLYRYLQRIDPVHHSPLGVVAFSKHADVSAALRNPAFGVDESKVDQSLFRLGPFAPPDAPDRSVRTTSPSHGSISSVR